ncbi:Uncharacterised protein [uncultured archaeon]|nr:Uncharacterised protein [uncultured archaeon]
MAVLKDIGDSLKALLQSNIPELKPVNSIVFDSPADIDPTGNPMLSIFLYQIIENGNLRNVPPEPIDMDKMRYPPLILDLYYMFTPFAKNKETELIIIEKLMQVFFDNSVLRTDTLTGGLKASGNDEIRVVPNNLSFDEINKLWERFPNKPFKLSASYILSPVRIPSGKPVEIIKRVMEKNIDVYRKEIQV